MSNKSLQDIIKGFVRKPAAAAISRQPATTGDLGNINIKSSSVISPEGSQSKGQSKSKGQGQYQYLWDRQRQWGESTRAYESFCIYRDMPVDERSFAAVKRAGGSLGGGANLGQSGTIADREWPKRFQWKLRAEAYDEYWEKIRRREKEKAREEMIERQIRLGTTMQTMALNSLESGIVVPESVSDVVRLADSGTKIERLARGESTDNQAGIMRFQWSAPLPPWAPKDKLGDGGEGENGTN